MTQTKSVNSHPLPHSPNVTQGGQDLNPEPELSQHIPKDAQAGAGSQPSQLSKPVPGRKDTGQSAVVSLCPLLSEQAYAPSPC